jgi:hypothetical protein
MINRRRLLVVALSVPAFSRSAGLAARPLIDSTATLQRAIDKARGGDDVVRIPPGASYVSRLRISGDARLVGAGRDSRLAALRPGPLLTIDHADSVAVENIAFDGAGVAPGGESALIEARDVADLRLSDCRIERAMGYGVKAER